MKLLPRLQRLSHEESLEGLEIAVFMEAIERTEIGKPIGSIDGARRNVERQEDIVHEQARRAAVAVCERVDVQQASMSVSRDGQRVALRVRLRHHFTHLVEQGRNSLFDLIGREPDIIGNAVVTALERTGTLPFRPSVLIVGSRRQKLMGTKKRQGVNGSLRLHGLHEPAS